MGNAAQDESELPDSADFREVANLADTAPGLTETAEASKPPKAARGRSEFPDWTDSTHAADSVDPAAAADSTEAANRADLAGLAAPADSAPGGSEVSEAAEAAEASRTPKAATGRNGSGGKALRGKSTKTKKTSGKKRGPKGKFNRELFEKVADRVRAGQKDTPAIQAEGMGRSAFYAQMAKDKELKQRLREARQGHELDLAEEAMFQRAVEGILKPVIRNGKVVGERRVYSDACLKALLEEYLPEKYGKPRKEKGRPLESREQREQRRAQEIATVHEHNEWDKKNARHAAADYLRACLEEGDDPGQWVYDFQAAEAAKDAGNLAEAAAKEASAIAASSAVWPRPQSRNRATSQNPPATTGAATTGGVEMPDSAAAESLNQEDGVGPQIPDRTEPQYAPAGAGAATGSGLEMPDRAAAESPSQGGGVSPQIPDSTQPQSRSEGAVAGSAAGTASASEMPDSTPVQTATAAPSATAATSAPTPPQLPDRVALAAAQEKAQRLEDELFRRAIEGYEQPVFGPEGEIGTVLAHSNRLLVFLFQSWRRRSPMAGKSAAQFEFEIEEREHKAQVQAIKQIGDIYGLPCQMIGRRFMAKHWHNIPAQNRTPIENPFPEV